MRSIGPWTVLLLALAGGGVAAADYEETETRLKSAGIDDALRAEIHRSIDRGVEWLRSVQRPDGGFSVGGWDGLDGRRRESAPPAERSDPGRTVLCALALRHAGTPAALEVLARARRFLFAGDPPAARTEMEGSVYPAGIAAMLVAADGGPRGLARTFADRLVRGQGRSGWWGYATSGIVDVENLSTTQFGALGLWAAARTGAEVPDDAWRRLAEAHVESQGPRGGWGYRRGSSTTHYPQGTFMGLANLVLAEAALSRLARPPRGLLAQVGRSKERALEALDRDGPEFLVSFELGRPAFCPHYALYALEKACLFADREECGEVRWYRRGARALVRSQRADGAWGDAVGPEAAVEDDRVATAFALLFLLRSSAAYHPTTPRDPDARRPGPPSSGPATTPSEPAPPR